MSELEVRVACQQLPVEVGQLERNRALTRDAVREAVSAGGRLVVLPELSNSGYVFESAEEARACAEPADGATLRAWSEEAERGDAVVVGGFCELGEDGLLYNSAAVVDGGVLAVYRELHLWDREQLVFEPGRDCAPVLETRIGRIGVGVCYDLNFPEVARGLALAGADIVVLPANFPGHPRPEGERPIEVTLAMATAIIDVAGLGFLGLGPQDPSTPEWGTMLTDTERYLQTAPHLALIPGAAIVVTAISINLIGDGLREALDPKLRSR